MLRKLKWTSKNYWPAFGKTLDKHNKAPDDHQKDDGKKDI